MSARRARRKRGIADAAPDADWNPDPALKEGEMLTVRKQVVAIYVDRASGQWVVRDADGDFWALPAAENPWDHRRPFVPDDDSELEPVPKHYKYMLGLPH